MRFGNRVRFRHSVGVLVTRSGKTLRSVINYKADGSVDASRSHYSVNGRRVTRRQYRHTRLW